MVKILLSDNTEVDGRLLLSSLEKIKVVKLWLADVNHQSLATLISDFKCECVANNACRESVAEMEHKAS